LQFLLQIQFQLQIPHTDIKREQLFFLILAFFANFEANRAQNNSKKDIKTPIFYKLVLEINCGNIIGLRNQVAKTGAWLTN
jgi:hypothetical protein